MTVAAIFDYENSIIIYKISDFCSFQSEPGQVKNAVMAAIDAGYRHIDGAFAYQNENEVGEAIRAKIDEGKVKREDLWYTTKVGTGCIQK